MKHLGKQNQLNRLNFPRLNFVLQEILFYFSQVLLGVNYIHNLNIIHRDLKAENILLTGKNGLLVKIGDFGISKMLARYNKIWILLLIQSVSEKSIEYIEK